MDWVPCNCRLQLSYDARAGGLRLINDYLGYLVYNTKGATVEEVVAAVHAAFEEGVRNPQALDVAQKSYYRRATPSDLTRRPAEA